MSNGCFSISTWKEFLTLTSCCLFFACRKRWLFASSLQYREGSRNAANENQHIAEDLKQTQTCPVGERSHQERAHDEEPGGPQGNHACSCQRDAQQHIAEQVTNDPAAMHDEHPPVCEIGILQHRELRVKT